MKTIEQEVAERLESTMGVTASAIALALTYSPATVGDHLVHGYAGIVEFERGGPKALQHLAYAGRRIHAAVSIQRDYAALKAKARVKKEAEWIRRALLALLHAETTAATAAASMHQVANDL